MEIQKVPFRTDLDLDWGRVLTDVPESLAHAVEIEPIGGEGYKLAVIMPDLFYNDGGKSLLAGVLTLFLGPRDNYRLMGFGPEDKEKMKSWVDTDTAFISYDPFNTTSYFWLIPPLHERN